MEMGGNRGLHAHNPTTSFPAMSFSGDSHPREKADMLDPLVAMASMFGLPFQLPSMKPPITMRAVSIRINKSALVQTQVPMFSYLGSSAVTSTQGLHGLLSGSRFEREPRVKFAVKLRCRDQCRMGKKKDVRFHRLPKTSFAKRKFHSRHNQVKPQSQSDDWWDTKPTHPPVDVLMEASWITSHGPGLRTFAARAARLTNWHVQRSGRPSTFSTGLRAPELTLNSPLS